MCIRYILVFSCLLSRLLLYIHTHLLSERPLSVRLSTTYLIFSFLLPNYDVALQLNVLCRSRILFSFVWTCRNAKVCTWFCSFISVIFKVKEMRKWKCMYMYLCRYVYMRNKTPIHSPHTLLFIHTHRTTDRYINVFKHIHENICIYK